MAERREFYSFAAAAVNGRVPRVGRNLVERTARRSSLFDLRLWEDCSLTLINEEMYGGARTCKDLMTTESSLKIVLNLTGNQCTPIQTEVM